MRGIACILFLTAPGAKTRRVQHASLFLQGAPRAEYVVLLCTVRYVRMCVCVCVHSARAIDDADRRSSDQHYSSHRCRCRCRSYVSSNGPVHGVQKIYDPTDWDQSEQPARVGLLLR